MNVPVDELGDNIFLADNNGEGQCWDEYKYYRCNLVFTGDENIIYLAERKYIMFITFMMVLSVVLMMMMILFHPRLMVMMRHGSMREHEAEQ
jgi:hypothetical protein